MKTKRIGLFKSALEALQEPAEEETQATPGEQVEEVVTADPSAAIKTDEIQPEEQPTPTPEPVAEQAPEQAPAKEVSDEQTAIQTGVTTDEDPAPLSEEELAELGNEEVEECTTADITEDVSDLVAWGFNMRTDGEGLAKAANAVDELEDLVQTAETSGVENEGGLAVLELAVEGIFLSIGLEHEDFVALESEEGQPTVKSKLEEIKKSIVRLIRSLIEAIRRAIGNVRDYLVRVTQVANRISKASLMLKREVRALKRDYTVGTLDNERLLKQIGVSSDTSISRAYQNLHELCVSATRSAKSGHIEYLNRIVDDFMNDRDDTKLIEELPKALARAFDNALPNDQLSSEFEYENIPEGAYILASNLLPGNAAGVLMVPKTTDDLRVFSYSIERAAVTKAGDLDILSKKEMEWLLDSIRATSGIVASFHRYTQDTGKLESRLSDALKRLDKDVMVATPQFRQFLQSLSAVAPALAQGIHEKTFAYAMQCSSAGLRYVEASLAKHKAEAKREEA